MRSTKSCVLSTLLAFFGAIAHYQKSRSKGKEKQNTSLSQKGHTQMNVIGKDVVVSLAKITT